LTFGTWRRWGRQPHAPAAFPQEMFLVFIFTRGWDDPRTMVRSEGNMSLKNPVKLPGMDPWTVRLVMWRLNYYATPGPQVSLKLTKIMNITYEDPRKCMLVSCWILLRRRNVLEKSTLKSNTHSFYVIQIFFSENFALYEIMWKIKYNTQNMQSDCQTTKVSVRTYVLIVFNRYFFFTAAMVSRTRLKFM
jgi:hypothetical protein